MLDHCLHDPVVQFEMAMVMSGMCKPTVGSARLMRVIRCIDTPALSCRKLHFLQKWSVLVDADHAPDETTRKSMSCDRIPGALIETQSARHATVVSSGGGEKYNKRNDWSECADVQYNSGFFHVRSLLWVFLHANLAMVILAVLQVHESTKSDTLEDGRLGY